MPTDRRIQRLSRAIHARQLDLILALDRVHDPHNLAACLRTADATGISRVLWEPDTDDPEPPNPLISKGTERWVELSKVDSLVTELLQMQQRGFKVAATHLSREAVDFRSIDWTHPWILVMGNEKEGCSNAIVSISDANVVLPMVGLVQSLNISVATAVMVYEIQRQREAAGMYRRTHPAEAVEALRRRWRLHEEGITLEELSSPPPFDTPLPENAHTDGRMLKPRWEKRRPVSSPEKA